jgi:hypothetical protein
VAHAASDAHARERRLAEALRAAAAALAGAAADPAALAALGARVDDGPLAPRVPLVPPPAVALGRSIEAWAFAAGQKPVALVTVAPAAVDATVAQFAGAHVERRERRVEIGPQDRWRDDRARGEPRVELYLARDPALARRAAALQAEDPSRHAEELGALFGYPPCCVRAFAAQAERGDNSLNRYLAAARTEAGPAPWPWPLNELHLRLIAFYPCSYLCPAARTVADVTMAAIAAAHPGAPAALAAALSATVLYLDHDHQLWLTAAADPEGADTRRYRAVAAVGTGRALPALARLFAAADRLRITADRLELLAGATPVATIDRAAGPGGVLARFG